MYAPPPALGKAEGKNVGSLTELQKALSQVRATRPTPHATGSLLGPRGSANPNASPSTLASTPDESTNLFPEYRFPATGPISSNLGFAGDDTPHTLSTIAFRGPATTDLATSLGGPSPAVRSELKALQEGLLRLKNELATRRARSREVSLADPKQRTETVTGGGRPKNPPELSSDMPGTKELRLYEEDAISQTDSAAPSAALQTHIMNAIQTLTMRLSRLEGAQRTIKTNTQVPSDLPNGLNRNFNSDTLQQPPPKQKTAKELCIEAALQSELTQERIRRLKLEAIIKALAPRVGLDSELLIATPLETRAVRNAAEREFDASALDSLQYNELRSLVTELSVRNKEAIRLYTSSKSKSVELTAALRTVSDLSMRIVTLEDELMALRDPVNYKAATESATKNDTIGMLSLRVRHQNMKIRSMQAELTTLREACRDAQFQLGGSSARHIQNAVAALKSGKPGGGVEAKSRSISSSPVRKGGAVESETGGINYFSTSSTPETCKSNLELERPKIYIPASDDQVDEAIAEFLNSSSKPIKVVPVRVSAGHYLYGRLAVRGGLSATSRIPLIFHNGKKFSLKKFIQTYEELEFALKSADTETHPKVEPLRPQSHLTSASLQGLRSSSAHNTLSRSGPATSSDFVGTPITDKYNSSSSANLHDKLPLVKEAPRTMQTEQNDLSRSMHLTQQRRDPMLPRYPNSERRLFGDNLAKGRAPVHEDDNHLRQKPPPPPRVVELPMFPGTSKPRNLQLGLMGQPHPQQRSSPAPGSSPLPPTQYHQHSRRETPVARPPTMIPVQNPFPFQRPPFLNGWDRNSRHNPSGATARHPHTPGSPFLK